MVLKIIIYHTQIIISRNQWMTFQLNFNDYIRWWQRQEQDCHDRSFKMNCFDYKMCIINI